MGQAFDAMVAGDPYWINDPELVEIRYRTRDLVDRFNALGARQVTEKTETIHAIFGTVGEDVHIEKPMRIDYGVNTTIGSHVFINFNLVVLDTGRVTIGDHVFIGPNVSLYAALHPMNIEERAAHTGTTLPITIGNNVWISGDAKIMPGVTIGDGAVIGAGSVVTKDVPAGMLAVGNPARILRKADPKT
ncbi:sugar O-acetyltransferase [Cohaesibacter haloalkalitolerans]|uniref:sugar O-acetyltransferase n=1 Tax=Cohaesibacter haloalkalitolerans TaxID=1162980 RepID=UPI001968AF53|nr:sugar O-acetyltransferase [Cohaesibacter haloalkalitolerans]